MCVFEKSSKMREKCSQFKSFTFEYLNEKETERLLEKTESLLKSSSWRVFSIALAARCSRNCNCLNLQRPIQNLVKYKPLSANPTEWSSTLKQVVSNFPTNCLSLFDHFVGLALKGLRWSVLRK